MRSEAEVKRVIELCDFVTRECAKVNHPDGLATLIVAMALRWCMNETGSDNKAVEELLARTERVHPPAMVEIE